MEKSLLQNDLEWNELYEKLADDESKAVLESVALFRLTADPSIMEQFSVRLSDQYMEDFMCFKNEKFVDVGGFDGDTTLEFCTRYPDYQKVYMFEPSSKNMAAAKNRLKSFFNIDYFNFGLSDKEESLMFNESQGSASNIQNEGDVEIKVSMLDKLIQDEISFIKMDIEGWELNALKGASRHIVEDHPKLAVAVYHHATDFVDIPKFILSLNNNYKIYLRHYTQGWSETVMFFLPI
jgi:FkbM family methyltransferase